MIKTTIFLALVTTCSMGFAQVNNVSDNSHLDCTNLNNDKKVECKLVKKSEVEGKKTDSQSKIFKYKVNGVITYSDSKPENKQSFESLDLASEKMNDKLSYYSSAERQ